MVGCSGGIIVAVVVVIAGGRRRAAEHAPVAREVDEGQRERAHEAGGAGQGDGFLDGVPRPAEEEPVRHDRGRRRSPSSRTPCPATCTHTQQPKAYAFYILLVTMPSRHARAISWYAHNWNATKH